MTSGGLIATGLYFGKTIYFHVYFLDTMVSDAKVLLKTKTFLESMLPLRSPNHFWILGLKMGEVRQLSPDLS